MHAPAEPWALSSMVASVIFKSKELLAFPYVFPKVFVILICPTDTYMATFSTKVFARDIGTAPPYEKVKVRAVNVPVKLQASEQDTTIRPGDYLIGDANGVVLLPRELALQALPLMAKQVEADDKMAEDIQKGMSFVEASKKHRV